MRICVIANAKSVHVVRWVSYLVSKGHDVHVISHYKNEIKGARVHKLLTISKINFLSGPMETWGILRKIKPDVVHAFQISPYGFHASVAGSHPLIVTAMGSDISTIVERSGAVRRMCRFVLKRADLLHAGDASGRKRLIDLGADKEKIAVMSWGVDTKEFSPRPPSTELKGKLRTEGSYVVINVCYLNNEHYNVDTLIEAAPLVLREVPNVKFIVAGSGKLETDLKKLAKERGVKESIIFMGGIKHEELPPYFNISDVYVDAFFPVTAKGGGGLGVSTTEAMASGVPAIVTKRQEIDDMGGDFKGLVFMPRDPASLAERIVYLLKSENLRAKIGKESREVSLRLFDWETNMGEWGGIYVDMAKKSSKNKKKRR